MKYSNYYINKLADKAKKNMFCKWRLGEVLHEITVEGGKVINENGIIIIKEDVK